MRHLRWLQALLVVTVMVLLNAREAGAQQRVLVYGPGGADATSFFGSGAATVTVASAATWRSMTSADFGAFDQIWVEGLQCSNNSALFDTLIATRNVWGPVVTGRVVFNHADEDHHAFRGGAEALQAAQAQLLIRNSFGWLRTGRTSEGGATSMYLSSGCLVSGASPSFLSNSLAEVFGPGFTDNFAERNAVAITTPGMTHPVSVGLTIPGLQWNFFCHGGIPTFPSGFQSLVTCASPGAGEPQASGLIVRDRLPPCPVTTGQCVPAVPVVVTPANGSTSTPRPTVTGTATPGSTVNVFIDGALVGTTTATSSGTFSLPLSRDLSVGTHTVNATATQTGISSLPSNTNTFRVVGCTSNADCSGGTPICDGTTRLCRPCGVSTQAADCPSAVTPVCSTFAPTTGRCVPRAPVVVTPANGSTTGNRPPITGTSQPGAFITVVIDGVVAGMTTADSSGNWTFTPTTPLTAGPHAVFAIATAGGLPSGSSNTNGFVVASCTTNADCSGGTPICDRTSGTCRPCGTATMAADCTDPGRPLCSTSGETAGQCIPAAPVVATPANGSTTASQRPAITGTAAPGSTVTILVDGMPVGTTTATPSGTFSFTPGTNIPLGMHTASATATLGGVRSPLSNVNSFRVVGCTTNADCSGGTPVCDTAAGLCRPCTITTMATDCPTSALPVCSTVAPTAGRCVPASPTVTTPANGSTTTNPRPAVTGTAPPGSTVTVTIDGMPAGTTMADPSGNYTFTPPMSLATGSHTVSATATLGGVPSGSSPTNTFRVVQCATSADCSGSTPVCNVAAGLCRPCAAATMDIDCTAPGFPVCATTGASTGQCVPSVPAVITPADGSTTANPRPAITGTSAPNITVVVYVDGVEVGRTMSDPMGRWNFVPSTNIPVGMHRATAAGANPSGGLGAQSPANMFRVVQCVVNTDCAGTSVCDTATNTCRGCTTNADCSGSTPICDMTSRVCRPCAVVTMTTDCPDAMRPVCATAGMSSGQCVPVAPAVVTPADGSTTANPRPAITGTAPAGSTVVVYIDGVEVGRATADPMGRWTFTPTMNLSAGPHTVTAAISTPAGVGPMSPTNNFRVVQCLMNSDCPGMAMCNLATNTCGCATNADCPVNTPICDATARTCRPCAVATMATDCPTMELPVCATTGSSAGQCVGRSPTVVTPADGSTTANPRPAITGTAPAGSTVVVYVDGVEVGRAMTDPMGRWTFTPTMDIPRGMHTVSGAIATGMTVGPRSNPNTFRVVPCTMDSECASPTPVCDTASSSCVVCTTGAMGNAMACAMNVAGNACQRPGAPTTAFCGCTLNSHCPADRRCDTAMSLCVPNGDGGTDAGDAMVDAATDATDAAADAAVDAAVDVRTDAGVDAAAADAAVPSLSFQGGGCACHTTGAGSSSPRSALGLFAAMLALGAVRRRKRD